MKKSLLATAVISLLSFSVCFGQGIVRGKITDNTGEALIGATVVLKSNNTSGVMADLDGNYSIKVLDTAAQTLVVTYVSYKNQEVIVHPVKGEVIVKDFVLVSASTSTLDEVVIATKAVRANNYYMENMKMKSSTTMDYISQETMKKTGDVNVINAVARVSGVSSSSSTGIITVRGIGDRYVKTTLNGLRIPTLDLFTNNIRLDLFPASLVDNIVISKTASPDLPGDWAGAYISIETKDYPDKLTVNVETSLGFVPQSTFKNIISSQQSSTDWLGYDNSFRDHSHNPYGTNPIITETPSPYQTMAGLGLGNYYNSIGVTNSTPWNSTYFDLGLVKLGLLNQSQLSDPNAIANATAQFNNGPYKSQAFTAVNAPAVKNNQSFKDDWNTTTRQAIPNITQNLSIGNQVNLFGKPLGFLIGLRYNSATQYDPNSVLQRVTYQRAFSTQANQQISSETHAWSGLINLAYKYSANHSINLLFMPNFTGVNQARNSVDNTDPTQVLGTVSQFYDQRKQLIYQLKSEHYIPKPQLKIDFNASYTSGKNSAPDFRDFSFYTDDNRSYYTIDRTVGDGVHRYFRYLTDNLFDSKLSAELPILKSDVGVRKLKFGGSYQYNNKRNDLYDYNFRVATSPTTPLPTVHSDSQINDYFALNNFGVQNGGVNYWYIESGSPVNHTFGHSSIAAAYLMTDFTIIKPLRIAGGVRMEKADVYTDASLYDSLHYAVNDARREYQQGYPLFNPGKLNTVNFLPSVSLIYRINKNEDAPMNLRANFSQTVARPSVRELTETPVYDFYQRNFYIGNANLKQVSINNYDLRYEWYFKNRDYFSVGGFYKDFTNHIELVTDSFGRLSWRNASKSYVTGLEIEGRKSIIKNLDLMANVTFASSKSISVINGTHPMYGQAPYIVNAVLSYNIERIKLITTLSYNIQGPRLSIVSSNHAIPNVYEMPRNMFDFKIMKQLGKHFAASFTVRDILNTAIRRVYMYSDGTKIDYDRYRYGTNYVVSLSYKI